MCKALKSLTKTDPTLRTFKMVPGTKLLKALFLELELHHERQSQRMNLD